MIIKKIKYSSLNKCAILFFIILQSLITADEITLRPGDIIELILEEQLQTRQYFVERGDLIEVRFLNAPELSVEQRVRPDGMVSLPYIGDISVVDSTPNSLRNYLEELYLDEIATPRILVLLKQQGGRIKELRTIMNQGDRYSRQIRVRSDGYISLPLVDECLVKGLSISAATDSVKAHYERVRLNVSVSLSLYKSEGSVVSVLGAVQKPGSFEIYRPLSIIDALALASGPRSDAALRRALLISVEGETVTYKKINCRSYLRGKEQKSPMIAAGQVLYIPRTGFSAAAEITDQLSKILFVRGLTVDLGRLILNEK